MYIALMRIKWETNIQQLSDLVIITDFINLEFTLIYGSLII